MGRFNPILVTVALVFAVIVLGWLVFTQVLDVGVQDDKRGAVTPGAVAHQPGVGL